MDDVSVTSSFYTEPVQFDEAKTKSLYEKVKTDFQEIQNSLNKTKVNLKSVQKESLLTMQLIRKIESAKANAQESDQPADN